VKYFLYFFFKKQPSLIELGLFLTGAEVLWETAFTIPFQSQKSSPGVPKQRSVLGALRHKTPTQASPQQLCLRQVLTFP
jgi:hypothetical protein